jgi:hypothetical protein
MAAWAQGHTLKSDFDPERHIVLLVQALGDVSATLNRAEPDHQSATSDCWWEAAPALLNILMFCVDLRTYFTVPAFSGEIWPDGTRIGGDGAYQTDCSPRHLLGEMVQAAGWIAEWLEWVVAHPADTRSAKSQATELITELEARTWYLIHRLHLREPLRQVIQDDHGNRQAPPATA